MLTRADTLSHLTHSPRLTGGDPPRQHIMPFWRLAHSVACARSSSAARSAQRIYAPDISHRQQYDTRQLTLRPGCMCRFECRSDGTYLQVFYVGLEPTGDEPDETEYTGPVRRVPWLKSGVFKNGCVNERAGMPLEAASDSDSRPGKGARSASTLMLSLTLALQPGPDPSVKTNF